MIVGRDKGVESGPFEVFKPTLPLPRTRTTAILTIALLVAGCFKSDKALDIEPFLETPLPARFWVTAVTAADWKNGISLLSKMGTSSIEREGNTYVSPALKATQKSEYKPFRLISIPESTDHFILTGGEAALHNAYVIVKVAPSAESPETITALDYSVYMRTDEFASILNRNNVYYAPDRKAGVLEISDVESLRRAASLLVKNSVGRALESFKISTKPPDDPEATRLEREILSGAAKRSGAEGSRPSAQPQPKKEPGAETGKRGEPRAAYLGVVIATEKASEPGEGAGGVKVKAVDPEGPAAAGGIRIGDILTAIDGKTVESAETFAREIAARSAGDTITISGKRAGGLFRLAEQPAIRRLSGLDEERVFISYESLIKAETASVVKLNLTSEVCRNGSPHPNVQRVARDGKVFTVEFRDGGQKTYVFHEFDFRPPQDVGRGLGIEIDDYYLVQSRHGPLYDYAIVRLRGIIGFAESLGVLGFGGFEKTEKFAQLLESKGVAFSRGGASLAFADLKSLEAAARALLAHQEPKVLDNSLSELGPGSPATSCGG